jgi:hypothetical protein
MTFELTYLKKLRWWDEYLGHGRMLESCLVAVKYMYAGMYILASFTDIDPAFVALKDLDAEPILVAIPFFLMASVSLAGLILNASGYDSSRYYRILGATMGMTMWLFILGMDFFVYHIYFAGVHPWVIIGILGSLWIIRRGVKGLPVPGASGLV